MWLGGLKGISIKAMVWLGWDPAIQPQTTHAHIMFAGIKEKFNKLSPTAKLLVATFVLALLSGAGFMGYKWYQNRQDPLATSTVSTDSEAESGTDSDSEEALGKPPAVKGLAAKPAANTDGAPSRVPKPKSSRTAARQPPGDATTGKSKKK